MAINNKGSINKFYRDQLDPGYYNPKDLKKELAPQHRAYKALEDGFANFVKEINVGDVSKEDALRAWEALRRDNPLIYYVRFGRYVPKRDEGRFMCFTYKMTRLKAMEVKSEIDSKNVEKLRRLTKGKTKKEKFLIIHDFIAQKGRYADKKPHKRKYNEFIDEWYTDPNYFSTTDHSMEGPATLDEGVCSGFAMEFNYYCTKLGLWSIYVTGMAGTPGDRGRHAWNIINAGTTSNPEYYHVDCTWDLFEPNMKKGVNSHWYFMLSDDEIHESRTIERMFKIPKCTHSGGCVPRLNSVEELPLLLSKVKKAPHTITECIFSKPQNKADITRAINNIVIQGAPPFNYCITGSHNRFLRINWLKTEKECTKARIDIYRPQRYEMYIPRMKELKSSGRRKIAYGCPS